MYFPYSFCVYTAEAGEFLKAVRKTRREKACIWPDLIFDSVGEIGDIIKNRIM